jgi:tetratricopeptide (TPR) repeat protein
VRGWLGERSANESATNRESRSGGAVAQFSKDKWPSEGPVYELLSYLDQLHRDAGQPSLADIGKAVALAPSTLSTYFTGARLINRGNLELLVEYLGGDVDLAEQLRRKAATAWNTQRGRERDKTERTEQVRVVAVPEGGTRLELVLFDAPVNRLNRPERLVGRQGMIDKVDPLLDVGGRVLLYGLGGIGKTALAATIADQRLRAGKGRYLWLRSGPAEADAILDALARALATTAERELIRSTAGDARLLAIGQMITRTGVRLCVVDDAWDPPALHALLRAVPERVGVLVTSRLKLGLPYQIEIGELAPTDAAQLLVLHANADARGREAETEKLCRELGYHPYAIEIAGHHLRLYETTPQELSAQIAGAPHELPMPGGFAPTGRENVRRLLDHTLDALANPDAAEVLRAIGGFFTGTATVELLAAYLAFDEPRAQRALNDLVSISLAKRQPESTCYEVHDLTFSYARALHATDAERVKTVVGAVSTLVSEQRNNHELLARELGNILGAATIAKELDDEHLVTIIDGLTTGGYLDVKGHTLALLRLLDDAIATVRGRPGWQADQLHLLLSKRGNAFQNQGDYAAAASSYREALELAPTPQREVVLLSVLGRVLAEQGHHDEAAEQFGKAYTIAESTGDEYSLLRILEQHGIAAFRRKNYEQVRELTTRGVELAQRLGERLLEAVFLNNWGTAEFELGVKAALERHERARTIAAELHNDNILALTHRTLGADYHAQENFESAERHFSEALRLYAKLGQTERETKLRQLMTQFGYLR